MYDDIKFRAWMNNKMIYCDQFEHLWDFWSEVGIYNGIPPIMEFTKDKIPDGADIYQDDIIEFDEEMSDHIIYNRSPYRLIGRVTFVDGGWCLLDKKGEYVNDLWSVLRNKRPNLLGNVHESPDLWPT